MERSNLKRRIGVRGFSLIELLIVIAIILVIIGIALPKFNVAQMTSRELAAQQELRTISTAQVQYQSQFGRYATNMAELGPPASGNPGPAGADLVPSSLAGGEKDQYTFTLTATQQGYSLVATPKVYNSSGRKSFYTDQSMIIRESMGPDPANATSPEIK
jgi:type IV pilus assembly protein PilA